MNVGFCVPIHYDHTITAVSIAGEKPGLGAGVRSALHLMSLFAHNRIRALAKSQAAGRRNLLTEREYEVLQWVSASKSDWEISTILHISEHTARAHVKNAARKLKAVNRPAVIAEALRIGEISLNFLEPIQKVGIQRQEAGLIKRRSMMRIMARRTNAAAVRA